MRLFFLDPDFLHVFLNFCWLSGHRCAGWIYAYNSSSKSQISHSGHISWKSRSFSIIQFYVRHEYIS
jgi:uncharacterized protein YlbG (UPF0298 family)